MSRIVLCYPVEGRHIDMIRRAAPGDEIVDAGQERIAEALFDADLFCGHAKVPVPWDEVVSRGRLEWIQSSAAGLDHCLVPAVIDSEIVVSSASGLFADQVAEQTLALIFGLYRRLQVFLDQQHRREFERRPTWDVHGKTIGIVGLGGNGRRIAELLAPLGNRMLAVDWFPEERPAFVESLWGIDRLDDLLAQSDLVILGVPLNEHTHHLLDGARLDRMRRGAVLINVARGPVVDEAALIERLESGHLAGAGLDVTEIEPLPTTSRLWELPNVLITPHVGAQSRSRVDDSTKLFCVNLVRRRQGKPLLNRVDKRLGFPEPSVRARSLAALREEYDRHFG
ncbi:MAG TPA: D-2-hydroxyacid dehydrogenase [Planctomycetaceae bacterium]|nr:D-2-hydroxyacid dehydrogenase [Planctomycetaceae bacterium]HRF01998.1 D-2-hydroxyacid dehydrogenase [Pirellulaceae bacterium]